LRAGFIFDITVICRFFVLGMYMETLYSKLSGVTHSNPDGSNRQEIIEALAYKSQPLLLVREPNQYSYDNIGVYVAFQIGYVNPELAGELAPLMDEGVPIEAQITEITGGTDEKPTRGVNVSFTIFE
jgi:hypothetical protein